MDQLPASSPGEPSRPADGDRRQAERRLEDRHKIERVSVRGLLAALLAGIALLFAAFAWWQQSQVRSRLDALRVEQQKLKESSARLHEEFRELNERAHG